MEIVILDGYTINPGDLSWKRLELMADKFTVFDKTPTERLQSRIGLCDVVMTSKCPITRELMENAPNLKYIGSTATGYNNIDIEAMPAVLCKNHGPFTWGKDAHEAVHNAVVLEEVAKMAYRTELINKDVKPAPQELQDKHYYRKHGANAYYGQSK